MKINWEKKGFIYAPSGEGVFKTHATRPIPYQLDDRTLRLYLTSRDYDDRPLPTYIDVDINDPQIVLHVNQYSLLELGKIGTFDDSGITPVSILDFNDRLLMYYVGWKRRRINVTFEASIGICEFERDDMSLKKLFEGPVFAQDKNHPFLVAGPFVIHDEGKFKMWYCNGTEWRVCQTGPEPLYRIHYAESENGIDWTPFKEPSVDYNFDGEVLSAPWVIKNGNDYHMWYSKRGSATRQDKNYSVGYAQSQNGIQWTRHDDLAGIITSDSGWDSEMVCYPSFFPYKEKIYMFYSGNSVGKGGIGYAVAENFVSL